MTFVKGKSGNPGGKSKEFQSIGELARRYAPEMIKILNKIARDRKAAAASRVSAASLILDRAFGRVPSFSTTDLHDFRRAIEMTDEQLIAIAQAGGVVIDMPVPGEAKSLADYPPVTPGSSSTKQIKQYQ